jgi:hypothetical protein
MFMAVMEEIPINNQAVLNILQIIKAVMSSAAEAKLGALFINAENGGFHTKDTRRNGTLTIMHSHPNQQLDRTRTNHQQDLPQSTEGHGHAIPLVILLQRTGPV